MNSGSISALPLWAVFSISVAMVFFSITIGCAIGRWYRKFNEDGEGPVGSITGAMLGLLAFILAFTFGMAASRFDTRKQLLLEEVNIIETAYLRTSLIPEPYRSESQRLLKEYAKIRATIG